MFVAEDMYQLGSQRSAIRELFEYGKQRAAVVGAENVYDFSLGNPTVPAPDCVNETIRDLTQKLDSISLHGYTSAQGDIATRQAIADYLNKTYETAFLADNFYLTMGAAASLSVCFRALTTSPEDEFITIAPFSQNTGCLWKPTAQSLLWYRLTPVIFRLILMHWKRPSAHIPKV